MNDTFGRQTGARERALLLGNIPAQKAKAFFAAFSDYDILLLPLIGQGEHTLWPADIGYNLDQFLSLFAQLRKQTFDLVIIPYDGRLFWQNRNLIALTAGLAPKTMVVFSENNHRIYSGEDVHRLEYNAAYINQLFKYVPPLVGKRLLDVGCSDGLVCNLMLNEQPEAIAGIDILENVGHNHPHPRVTYARMDASQMLFDDASFDLCYCIAVLEHVKDPFAVLRQIKRVTRPGGYAYIQAGPLYFSAFGHHMFGYFDEYPWIHLRLSKEQIAAWANERGIDQQIALTTGQSMSNYLDSMLNVEHINGCTLEDYRLDEFMSDPAVEVLSFTQSMESEHLLTPIIEQELADYSRERLLTHGFELAFRVR